MVEVLESNPSFSQQLGRELGQAGGNIASQFVDTMNRRKQMRQENEASKRFGADLTGINDPKLRQIIIQNQLKGQAANAGKSESSHSALQIIKRMRDIGAKNNLGRGSGFAGFFGGETAKDIGEYQQLGKSLIQYATTIPIRNKLEFETLAEKIYDTSLTDSERAGVLDAMERIISGSLQEHGGSMTSMDMQRQAGPQKRTIPSDRPPLTSFYR